MGSTFTKELVLDLGPSLSLAQHISRCRKNLNLYFESDNLEQRQNIEKRGIWIVFGNEAHALDSMGCALVYAYFLSREQSKSEHPSLVLPVMNIPRNEASLRKDNLLALDFAGIDHEDLIYMDEIPITDWARNDCLNIVLCDHNELSPRQKRFEEFVRIIIDHHKDSKKYDNAKKLIRFPTGSCSSLLTSLILEKRPEILKDPVINFFLRASILMDTQQFTDAGKTTDFDIIMCGELLPISSKHLQFNCEELDQLDDNYVYTALMNARLDTAGMSTVDIIKKDLKYAEDVNQKHLFAISTIKKDFTQLGLNNDLSKADFVLQIANLMNSSDENIPLHGYFILCSKNDHHKRLVAAIRTSELDKSFVSNNLEEELQKEKEYGGLKLIGRMDREAWPETLPAENIMFSLYELDKPVSRKQVLPFLTDWFGLV